MVQDQLTLLRRLRLATSDHHARIEQELDLLNPTFDLSDYTALLRRFYGIYSVWEPRSAAVLDPVLPGFFTPRRKTPLLEFDLSRLGSWSTPQRCTELEGRVASLAHILGEMYVLEGSTLGGRILSRHFGERFGIGPGSGCSFFSAYGEQTGAMWKAFGETVERFAAAGGHEEKMVAGACDMFDSVRRWLVAGGESDA